MGIWIRNGNVIQITPRRRWQRNNTAGWKHSSRPHHKPYPVHHEGIHTYTNYPKDMRKECLVMALLKDKAPGNVPSQCLSTEEVRR